jgi:hypothetical protein
MKKPLIGDGLKSKGKPQRKVKQIISYYCCLEEQRHLLTMGLYILIYKVEPYWFNVFQRVDAVL